MKKNLRKMFALMLALALSLTMLQGVAFAVDSSGNGWELKGGTLTIDNDTGMSGWIAHVHNLADKTPTRNAVQTVIIQSGVTSIGANAFQDCTNLTTVTIPDTVTAIGHSAFRDCDALTSVDLRGVTNLVKIENMAFYLCDNLTSIIIPNSVTSMGEDVFDRCKKLTSVTLPNNLQKISEQMFQNCDALPQITIPAGVTSIEDEVFEDCFGLTTITFAGSKIANFGAEVFNNADKLQTINFAGDYDPANTPAMITALANALTGDGLNLGTININYNQNAKGWDPDGIAALAGVGFDPAKIQSYDGPKPTPAGSSSTGGGGTGGGAGVWYIGTGVPHTQIIDTPATTAMLETDSVITVTGQSPTGIIVKLDPTALSAHNTVTINNSIENITLTATQIANLVGQADGGVVHITIKGTPDGVSVTATAGGQVVTL